MEAHTVSFEHFSRVVYIDFRYSFFDESFFAEENPDVALYALSQRQFLWFPEPPGKERW